ATLCDTIYLIMANHLASSTSPYLLQHAYNPVDWYPWGAEALEKARHEDKPIFLSIGYAACHWCHVMAHESFENIETAALMNAHFVSIKVDREERPDLDSIYMSAVMALTGQGGWPMSVFLTPDLQPFYGGTYFPPEPRHGLPAFRELLLTISNAWKDQREEITRVGGQIAAHLLEQSAKAKTEEAFTPSLLSAASHALIDSYDWNDGGWGAAPKFPQPMTIDFLLRRFLAGDTEALKPVVHALSAMARGGMYDVVGGGFARYSTDNRWRVPHFEKMLYDNAQLAQVYLRAWQVTGEPSFRRVVEKILGFVAREMLSPESGFYSSLDADSEGEEGKFYIWSLEELRSTLGEAAGFFESAYGVTAGGNWEGKNVLQRAVDDATLASRFGLSSEQVAERLAECHAKLLVFRNTRVRPGTDDKVLTAWNGLMLSAFAEAGRVFNNSQYLEIATRNAGFLLTALRRDGKLRRAWRAGQAGNEVFLEDYASLILGLLELYQTDFNNHWFLEAYGLAEEMLQRFSDPTGGFFDTPSDAEILLARPKDLQDNATPSGNALAAEALLKLAEFTEKVEWRVQAEKALGLVAEQSVRYPTAFGRWLSAADFALENVKQVAIIGTLSDKRTMVFLGEIRKAYHPNLVVAVSSAPPPEGAPALLTDRPMVDSKPTTYVCEGFVCQQPVTNLEDFQKQL
ncbi:MAG TPA: thioredoxin domain-containing protein, partial [Anaerolineales bacterium]